MKKISFRDDILPLKNVLYRLALRITMNREDAEDVVQDTMLKVWNRRERWGEIESIEAFSLTVCRNLALDRLKQKSRQFEQLDESDTASAPQATSNPYEQTARQDRVNLVRQLIDSLPEKQRACIQLRDFEGKTYREVAEALGITEEQVKVSIFRARQAIKQRFQKLEEYGL